MRKRDIYIVYIAFSYLCGINTLLIPYIVVHILYLLGVALFCGLVFGYIEKNIMIPHGL
jgi:hypothetical protein